MTHIRERSSVSYETEGDERVYAAPPFSARGPVSEQLLSALRRPTPQAESTLSGFGERVADAINASHEILRDDDLQLALLVLHGLHYGSVVDADDEWEWHPELVAARVAIEREFERQLRELVPTITFAEPTAEGVASTLFELTKPTPGPSVAQFVARKATEEQAKEYVKLRSVYT